MMARAGGAGMGAGTGGTRTGPTGKAGCSCPAGDAGAWASRSAPLKDRPVHSCGPSICVRAFPVRHAEAGTACGSAYRHDSQVQTGGELPGASPQGSPPEEPASGQEAGPSSCSAASRPSPGAGSHLPGFSQSPESCQFCTFVYYINGSIFLLQHDQLYDTTGAHASTRYLTAREHYLPSRTYTCSCGERGGPAPSRAPCSRRLLLTDSPRPFRVLFSPLDTQRPRNDNHWTTTHLPRFPTSPDPRRAPSLSGKGRLHGCAEEWIRRWARRAWHGHAVPLPTPFPPVAFSLTGAGGAACEQVRWLLEPSL